MPRKKPPLKILGDLCGFCQQEEDHPLLGALVKTDEVVLHSNCIFAASGLSQDKEDGKTEGDYIEGFHVSAIRKELKRGRLLHCSHCHRHGASVGCVVGSCPRSFHLPCITKAMGITIFEDPFPSYCRKHSPRQDLKPWFRLNAEVPLCCICLFSILPEDSSGSSTPSGKYSDAASATSILSTPVPRSVAKPNRAPRRSCVTVSTPKCIQISSGMSPIKRKSSLSNSTWELPDSPPHPDTSELDDTLFSQTPCHKVAIPNLPHIPAWLENYLIKLPSGRRISCYETWQYNTVHGMCCPKAWMHRSCIAKFAVTAALHYVKCPYCADKQMFIRSIIDAGIWVPDRDAAWELEPGAFADLAPVDENEENGSSSSESDTDAEHTPDTKDTRNISSEQLTRLSSAQNHVDGQIELSILTHTHDSESHEQMENPQPPGAPTPTRCPGQSKPILSLVWTAPPAQNQRNRRAPRSRRFTHQTTFDHPKSPPQPITSRRVRRRLSLYSRDSVTIGSHVESRLRQVTLGTFLASLHMSSLPE